MAHVEHYKSTSIKNIAHEFERDEECLKEDARRMYPRIDPSLIPNNYSMEQNSGKLPGLLQERLSQIKHSNRKDLNVMSAWIVTSPKELVSEADKKKFLNIAYKFCQERYGKNNVLNGYVHMDEPGAQPHIHIALIPVKDDRVSSKALFTRKELKAFHSELEKVMESEFGMKGLVLNGRTRGNYTVEELKERDRREAELKDKENSASKRETDAALREFELKVRKERLDTKEKKLAEREKALEGEINDFKCEKEQFAIQRKKMQNEAYEAAQGANEAKRFADEERKAYLEAKNAQEEYLELFKNFLDNGKTTRIINGEKQTFTYRQLFERNERVRNARKRAYTISKPQQRGHEFDGLFEAYNGSNEMQFN